MDNDSVKYSENFLIQQKETGKPSDSLFHFQLFYRSIWIYLLLQENYPWQNVTFLFTFNILWLEIYSRNPHGAKIANRLPKSFNSNFTHVYGFKPISPLGNRNHCPLKHFLFLIATVVDGNIFSGQKFDNNYHATDENKANLGTCLLFQLL